MTVDEILVLVNSALGAGEELTCPSGDANGDGEITVDEIIAAVNDALDGCGSGTDFRGGAAAANPNRRTPKPHGSRVLNVVNNVPGAPHPPAKFENPLPRP